MDTVIVAGRLMKRHGKLLHADVQALRQRVERACDGLFERAGVPRDGTWLPQPYVAGIT